MKEKVRIDLSGKARVTNVHIEGEGSITIRASGNSSMENVSIGPRGVSSRTGQSRSLISRGWFRLVLCVGDLLVVFSLVRGILQPWLFSWLWLFLVVFALVCGLWARDLHLEAWRGMWRAVTHRGPRAAGPLRDKVRVVSRVLDILPTGEAVVLSGEGCEPRVVAIPEKFRIEIGAEVVVGLGEKIVRVLRDEHGKFTGRDGR